MNIKFFKLSGVALAVSACLSTNAWCADNVADAQDVAQLRKQLGDLTGRYEAQGAALQALAYRLQQLENSGQAQARPIHAVNKTIVTADADSTQDSNDESKSTLGSNEPVVKEAPASRSAEAVYREQNALFNKTFTLETGVSYSHSDRRDPVRAAQAIIKAAGSATPPLWLLLGMGALKNARRKISELQKDIAEWEETTAWADHPKE